ncbi:MAG TPA: hypothetical protein VK747_24215 [Blastocatellia bacterium]|nr:hypothetical protein [Blastocatellia bacterium]
MRRLLFALVVLGGLVGGNLYPLSMTAIEANNSSNGSVYTAASPQDGHTIRITPWGPTQEMVDAAQTRALKHPVVRELLKGGQYRIISFQLIDPAKSGENAEPADSFKATIFDYTKNRAFVCSGRFDSSDLQVDTLLDQPDPDGPEFDAAVDILSRDPDLGPPMKAGSLRPYRPMPPLVYPEAAVGKANRTLAVGLMPRGINYKNQIVGVDMIARKVVRFQSNAPTAAQASPSACGLTGASQSTTSRGTAGQFQVSISRDGVEVWNFVVVRPSASSGTRASAVELLNVSYHGKRLLARAHAPILNVQYDRNLCGPYRDWSYQEGSFTANGTDAAPGIRMCTSPPQTILESGTDTGNFRGVAVYDNKEEVVLVSELEAGWYRYISRWTLTDSGVIKPRFGFGATSNSCVCNIHMHHVYWRLDFDIVTAANNGVTENTANGDKQITVEGMLPRVDPSHQTWTIYNTVSGESVVVRPGPWDGNWDKYGKGDVWVLNNHGELDDGVNCTSCGPTTAINLTPLVNGESTNATDIVFWYGAHFNHINGNVACGTSAGPDIEITRW